MKTLTRLFVLPVLFSLIAYGYCFAIDETVIQFRSFEDPDVQPNPLICNNAPFYDENFPAYVLLGASLWSLQTNAANGTVVNENIRQIGTGDACVKITDLSPGAEAPFYMEFEVDDYFIHGNGICTVSTNNIPVNGLILTGCTIEVFSDPATNVLGGLATSNSVFNPFGIPGFQTGSFWTLHLYRD